MSGVEAWMEPCAWGRDLVVAWPAAAGEEPPHLAVVVFGPDGAPLQGATSDAPALRHGDRWVARCLVNTIGSDEPVGSVHVDVVARRDHARSRWLTVPGRDADLALDLPVSDDGVLRRLTLGPGRADDTVTARVVVERRGAGEAKVSVALGFVGAEERTAWVQAPDGPSVITVEDLPVPPAEVLRLSVVVASQGPAAARPLGRVPVGPTPAPRALPGPADAAAVGVATLERGRLDARLQLPGPPGPVETCTRLWAGGVPVWSEVRRETSPDDPPVVRVRASLAPPPGPLALEIEARDLRVHDGALDVVLPASPSAPSPGPTPGPVGPVAIDGAWTYCEDRPDLGRFRGVRLLLRNAGPAPVAVSFRFLPPGQERGVRSGGELAPGGTDVFDLSDDGPDAGPARVELRVTVPGERSYRGVLPVVRFG